ncbi:MAG: SUMF1/EgtB/PvdO family nonheme iron enzyme [Anaerolineaceae bacterium]|nr:SUMF1/EgtB/PvdO family nonheme iron enzyme [Anaerolineaceae bacterium]
MKKFYYFLLLSVSLFIFSALIFLSSPYRELRPYTLFGSNITEKNNLSTRIINGRKTVLITSNGQNESFYIDQIPVTIADYKKCTLQGLCETQHYRNDYTKFWDVSIYESFPVTFITWMEARNYCVSYGGDLPTAQQWELAAGSDHKYDFPWGNSLPTLSKANLDGYYQCLTPAGWLPEGASPHGVLDMTGNVREWVLDEIFEDNDNKLLKGGCGNDAFSDGRIESAFNHGPTSSGFNRGFRCVYPVNGSK